MPARSHGRSAKFSEVSIGPRGSTVVLFERGYSKLYVRYPWNGRRTKQALGIELRAANGQISPSALELAYAEQQRVLECILAGTNPCPTGGREPNKTKDDFTLARGFRDFLAPDGPTESLDWPQRERYKQTQGETLRFFGPSLRADELTRADLGRYASHRQKAIFARTKGKRSGHRQAEIEVKCILRVLRWLSEDCDWNGIRSLNARKLLRDLREAQKPAQPRFTDEEYRRIQSASYRADPRIRLLITLQGAQRAGQLLRCRRSGVEIANTASGQTEVIVEVPGKGKKRAGRYILGSIAQMAFLREIESGYLRELERAFLETGIDYPLFPGSMGTLAPDAVVPPGLYPTLDRDVAANLFQDLEKLASVRHLPQRGFHGFRRRAIDVLVQNGATPAEIQAAGNWASSQIPMEVYREGVKDADRRRAAAKLDASAKQQEVA